MDGQDTQGGYEFFSDGFFGYGAEGDFVPYSLMHFIPIAVIILAIVFIYLKRDSLRSWKYEGRFRYIYAFIMLLSELSFFWRLCYAGDEHGNLTLMSKIPLQVCPWALLCAVFALMSLNDKLFGINFYVSICLTIPALFIPTVISHTGPTYFRYYQFWLEHGMPVVTVFYLLFVQQKKPKYWHLWLSVGLLFLLSIPSLILNRKFPAINYMYLGNYYPGSSNELDPIKFLPSGQIPRYLCMMALLIALFHLLYLIWRLIPVIRSKVQKT